MSLKLIAKLKTGFIEKEEELVLLARGAVNGWVNISEQKVGQNGSNYLSAVGHP